MNYSTAIFLVNKDVRAIKVSYEPDANGKGVAPFEAFKSLDPNITVGDYVIVPTNTRHKMTVVRVEEIEADVDLDSSVQLKWLIGDVSTEAYDAILAQEVSAIERIKSAEARARRKELADKLLADNPDIQSLADLNPLTAPALPAPASA